MQNCTLTIKSCKIHRFMAAASNYAFGKILWLENGVEIEKSFITNSVEGIACVESNKYAEANFHVEGFLTKKAGTKQFAGQMFEKVCLTSIKLAE